MGARKSRRSRSVKLDRNPYGSRPTRTRSPLPVVVVVCDDTRTAPAYFNELKGLVKSKLTLKVVPKPRDQASAKDVVECAIAELEELRRPGTRDEEDRQSVWALIDLEANSAQQKAARAAQSRGQASGVKIALSQPCYELWTLLHLVDTGQAFADCNAVLARLQQEWHKLFRQPFPHKAQADYSKIIQDRLSAARRARTHHQNGDPSWTEIYRLIDEIETFWQR